MNNQGCDFGTKSSLLVDSRLRQQIKHL